MTVRLFVGQDPREAIGLHVFNASVWRQASEPVSITALGANVADTDGTNAFTLSRFHVPRLCDYEGWALWMDGSDMLMLCDIAELWALRDDKYAVQVVKHTYAPRNKRKYIGTAMESANEAYPRKNWSSVILFNNERCKTLLHPFSGQRAHRFSWLEDKEIGELPKEFNWLADEDGQCHPAKAKVIHWTCGSPFMPYYGGAPFADQWRDEYKRLVNGA